MRSCFKLLLLAGLVTALPLPAMVPAAVAADLTVKPSKRAKAVRHHRSHIVADYDGTPIVLRRKRPAVLYGPDGPVVLAGLYAAHWAPRAIPTRYFNGQRIR